MSKASDLPIVESSIEVYEDLQRALEKMRSRATHLPDLLAIACVADSLGSTIKGLRLRRKKLAAVVGIAVQV